MISRIPLSVRTRLTLWHLSIMALILAAFALGVYGHVRERLFALIDDRLDKSLAIISIAVQDGPKRLAEIERHMHVLPFRVYEDGRLLYESRDWSKEGLNAARMAPAHGHWILNLPNGHIYHLKEKVVPLGERRLFVRTAKSGDQIHHDIGRLRYTLMGGFPLALLLSLAGGYFLAGRLLEPLRHLTTRARAISADNLSQRLAVPNPHDELGQLAAVLNEVFTRLEESFDRLKRFTQDAAHELRTPLAILRSVGEVGMQERCEAGDYREVIGSMLEEVYRLARLVDDLLTLSRADSGSLNLQHKTEDLALLCQEVIDCLRVLAEEKQQALSFTASEKLLASVDRGTLRLAVINLVANAIGFTPAGGEIRVGLKQSDGSAVIEVEDNGPGIAKQHQAHLFERFYRIDSSRSHERGGAGLGLAIAHWVVAANGGRIEIDSDIGLGSRFRIVLPLDRHGPRIVDSDDFVR